MCTACVSSRNRAAISSPCNQSLSRAILKPFVDQSCSGADISHLLNAEARAVLGSWVAGWLEGSWEGTRGEQKGNQGPQAAAS